MKKPIFILSCLTALFLSDACGGGKGDDNTTIDYKEEMRNFIIAISDTAKDQNANFIIIPQNGIELVTRDGENDGANHSEYLSAIDGNGQEDLYFGYDTDDVATDVTDTEYLRAYLDISKTAGNSILVTDYCATPSNVDESYSQNNSAGYVSFAADQRDLTDIPAYPSPIYSENSSDVSLLSEARNFLYLLDTSDYASKEDFIAAVTATNYDLLIMDLYFTDGVAFASSQITQLKAKQNGGTRLVVAYMSIGEAEDYRYYWDSTWNSDKPAWMATENPDWPGNYKVRYWYDDWQAIILGGNDAYLNKIIDAGFDGAYLDIIDAFEFFEN